RRVVDGGDGEREGLGRGSVDAAALGAGVVVDLDGDRGAAVLVGGGGERQLEIGRAWGRGREEGAVVVVDEEVDGLARFVGRAGGQGGGSAGGRLGGGVLEDGDVGGLGERRRVVDGSDGDGEGLRIGGVNAAVVGAAVVVKLDGDRGGAVLVGGGGERQL